MKRRMVITGGSGSLGRRLVARASAQGWDVTGTYLSTPSPTATVHLDIRDPAQVRDVLTRLRPDAVVHAAAGRDRNDWLSTADGAGHVAAAASTIRLVHVSSDAIFAGSTEEYDEDALPDPVYRYGAAKAAAETAVRAAAPDSTIVRTSLILGDGNGAHEILTRDLIAGRAQGALFTDEIRKPVHVDDLADALIELAGTDHHGILNVAGPQAVSRYDLGVLVARREGLDPALIPSASLAGLGLRRPADVRLALGRAQKLLSTHLRPVSEFLA
ncbi:SDR family oxidoreductase [Actinoplanes rectilineatus]|uniref:SDR family oxidoreductase n=1 Tax=Actinoplanes rectilineatus TaxID=113571 RepID=UPI001FE11CCE|nr:sugar nucleotide-binding protein [Actinoplanes rectilineatus]